MVFRAAALSIAMTVAPIKTAADAKALGASTDKGAVDALLGVLDTRDEPLREAAIESLKKLKAPAVLAARLGNKKEPERTRQEAARGLRFLADPSTVPALTAALSDPSAKLRAEAALSLSMFGAAQAEAQLTKCLDDADKDVRYYAADALGSVKTPAARAALEKRLAAESDGTVKYALKTALDKQGR